MKAELVPEAGGPAIPITRDVTVVGRREFCDVQVNDPSLSKRHCVLIKTDGLLVVRDLASTNGTKVKGQKVRWAALLPDDKLAFGSVKFRVYLGPDDLPSPSERPGKGKSAPTRPNAAPASGLPLMNLPEFAPPSPLQGTPILSVARPFGRAPEPLVALFVDDDDLVTVEDEDDEIIELD